ncbi:E3 ubiquitin protein like [Actinidia chinensis var. chinensis]|uniref:RING-type E3 ubiquitin transferase n=1 Tax=Actinidia chinensis var. chinensis TaxID=1590841 RepID=A0A2R6RQX8_ACTCC|nr:E3 ubiquitin protein like [Actinidia chinensis var. chinensis]
MAVSCLSISAVCTVLSFVGLQYWTGLSLEKLTSDGVISQDSIEPGNAFNVLQLPSGSQATVALLANFALNVFLLLILSVKTIFFVELYPSETRKLVERFINYVIYKGIFLPMIVPLTIFQVGLWSTWLIILCSLKMFQALARDRLERLNASPSATPFTYSRVYSVLLLVLSIDLFWIKLCLVIYRTLGSSMFLLLFFEPISIAFETLQAIVVHGFQLLDIWLHHSAGNNTNCETSKVFDISAGSLWEWKGILVRNLGFVLDIMTLLMALGHYVHIWWLQGMAFHLVDAVLFLNIRALLSAIAKRIKGFIRLRTALGALHGALPDATSEEIKAYDDECAICREPMAKAKRLSCNHLFHLACLRSWLDQGLSENYSCPTCRKPLRVGTAEDEANPRTVDVSTDGQLARQITSGLDRHNPPSHTLPTGILPNQMQNPLESGTGRGAGLDSSWLPTWSAQGLDGAGPSTDIGSARIGRVQMMMRHLASVGETYAQTALEDGSWSLWPVNPSQAGTSTAPRPPPGSVRSLGSTGGLRMRTTSRASNDNIVNILAMAETVREVLPHIPDELIFQDLQRTNSATVTVNNLLQT